MYNGTIDLSQLSDFSTSALEKTVSFLKSIGALAGKGGEKGAVAAVATAPHFVILSDSEGSFFGISPWESDASPLRGSA